MEALEILKQYNELDVKGRLKPCPFCGSENTDKAFDDYNNILIFCKDCNAQGGFSIPQNNAEDAIKMWNERKS